MTELHIVHDLFLLLHDDESGKASGAVMQPDAALAGALLLDLAQQGAMTVVDKRVQLGDPPADPLLVDAYRVIAGSSKPHSVAHWVQTLPRKLRPLSKKVGESLVSRGVLDKQQHRVLGLFKTDVWPERDPAPERALRAGLADVLVRGTSPDDRQSLLIPLLDGLQLVGRLAGENADKDDRKAARRTAKELSKAAREGKLVSSAVSQSVRATQAAVMVAVVTPAVVSSSN